MRFITNTHFAQLMMPWVIPRFVLWHHLEVDISAFFVKYDDNYWKDYCEILNRYRILNRTDRIKCNNFSNLVAFNVVPPVDQIFTLSSTLDLD